jgi:outer membrane protein assembly factor BamB
MVDSPPTISGGLAVFGSADGWVYCLRASDGQLAWRYRVAPEERRLVAFGQIESAWPAHGSVLIHDGSVYCAAGRSSYLDGGLRLYRLDLRTGKKLADECISSRDPHSGEQPAEPIIFEMSGALPDVLSSDGKLVYMRHLGFDPGNLKLGKASSHLYSPAGFLNDDWWHRTYWIYGEHFYSGYIGWYFAGRETPAGRLLAIDDSAVYGFAYRPEFYRTAMKTRYHLFAMDRREVPAQPAADYARANRDYPANGAGKHRVPLKWSRDVPVLARAMVLAGETLFLAGPPAGAMESTSAYEGVQGASLYAVSAADGKTRGEFRLDAPPVFDGLASARGRLFLTTRDGRLLCLSDSRSTPGRSRD